MSFHHLLAKAYVAGVEATLDGEGKLHISTPKAAEPIARELVRHKRELFRLLKLEEKIMRMPLSEFKKRGFILRLHSEVCGEIWFVSHEGLLKHLHPLEGKAVFTGEELEALLQAEPTDRDLQIMATAKRTFPLAKLKTDHH
jgi:hypothetical protein